MNQTSERAFRFPRSTEYAAEQFQPFEHTRLYPRMTLFGLNEKHRKRYNDYIAYWQELERQCFLFHEKARHITTILQSQFADRIETVAPLYLELPILERPYAFTGNPATHVDIGFFQVPEDAEECGKIIASAIANTARRLTLATSRSVIVLGAHARLLLGFIDSQLPDTELKTLLKLHISLEGRYAIAKLSVYPMCFQLNWYKTFMRSKRSQSEQKADAVPRGPDHGPFLELDECGRVWASFVGDNTPYVNMKLPLLHSTWTSEKAMAAKNRSNLHSIKQDVESVVNRLVTEVQAGVTEMVDVGPAGDYRGQIVL